MIRRESICGTMKTVRRHSEGAWALNSKVLGRYSHDCIAFWARGTGNLFPDAKRKSKGLWALIYVLRRCKYPIEHSCDCYLASSIEDRRLVSQKALKRRLNPSISRRTSHTPLDTSNAPQRQVSLQRLRIEQCQLCRQLTLFKSPSS